MVASAAAERRASCREGFQSPSLRGSGRFLPAEGGRGFGEERFNPLHCGAVVASRSESGAPPADREFQSPSLRGSGRFSKGNSKRSVRMPSFNPLHCGAVVASSGGAIEVIERNRRVSIPFIAGQWSLPEELARKEAAARVSIPFIAGQWSLQARARKEAERRAAFQSPSLRGSGRFGTGARKGSRHRNKFQSPSLRGSGRFGGPIPSGAARENSFNPLHCGAVVASALARNRAQEAKLVSIPFIAGQWSLRSR